MENSKKLINKYIDLFNKKNKNLILNPVLISKYLMDLNLIVKENGYDISEYLLEQIKNFDNHFNNIFDLKNGINSEFCINKTSVNTTDTLIYSKNKEQIYICVIKRKNSPDCGKLAFPGGIIELGEDSTKSALREANEETGLIYNNYNINCLGAIESYLWDSRFSNKVKVEGYSIEVDYNDLLKLKAQDDAKSLEIIKIEDLINSKMAFGHKIWLIKLMNYLNFDYSKDVFLEINKDKFNIMCDKILSNNIRKLLNSNNFHNIKLLFEEVNLSLLFNHFILSKIK